MISTDGCCCHPGVFGKACCCKMRMPLHLDQAIYTAPIRDIEHGSLNVPIGHHPTIRYMVYNGYYKVMSNIPKMGQLPTPVEWPYLIAQKHVENVQKQQPPDLRGVQVCEFRQILVPIRGVSKSWNPNSALVTKNHWFLQISWFQPISSQLGSYV